MGQEDSRRPRHDCFEMKYVLTHRGYRKEDCVSEGNSFLVGNGHFGYRGTLEEYRASEQVAWNLVGVYDQRGNQWRESFNLPNPFFFETYVDGNRETVFDCAPLKHEISLDLETGVFSRFSDFPSCELISERFASHDDDRLLASRIVVRAKKAGHYRFVFGVDPDIWDIHGPHFVEKEFSTDGLTVTFRGTGNEGAVLWSQTKYRCSSASVKLLSSSTFEAIAELEAGQEFSLDIMAAALEGEETMEFPTFDVAKERHIEAYSRKRAEAYIEVLGNEEADFAIHYSVYHLLALGDSKRARGIPARGVSGQTYKGAVFWDQEIFLLPFFVLTDPSVARRLLEYRIDGLPGAKDKAKEFGYEGAFYAWESQERGKEACSKYNVTDPITGAPVRTYFSERQIHISADIPHAFSQYYKATGDFSIFQEGGAEVIVECARFFLSFAKKRPDGYYHLENVIGPDEYHEKVSDNAFTNYMAKETVDLAIEMMARFPDRFPDSSLSECLLDFQRRLYLPKPNEEGLIEQFQGYFNLEDVRVLDLAKRLTSDKQYWGQIASSTRVIKQADVAALLSLIPDAFPLGVKKTNFDFYLPYTEHGSSLSSSMYALLGLACDEVEGSYALFLKSAKIDYEGQSKQWAGGVYIGGTHPASNGGAYIDAVYGFCGLDLRGNLPSLHPKLPKEISGIRFRFQHHGKRYLASVTHDDAIIKEELA